MLQAFLLYRGIKGNRPPRRAGLEARTGYTRYPVNTAKSAKNRAAVERYRAAVERYRAVVEHYRAVVERFWPGFVVFVAGRAQNAFVLIPVSLALFYVHAILSDNDTDIS